MTWKCRLSVAMVTLGQTWYYVVYYMLSSHLFCLESFTFEELCRQKQKVKKLCVKGRKWTKQVECVLNIVTANYCKNKIYTKPIFASLYFSFFLLFVIAVCINAFKLYRQNVLFVTKNLIVERFLLIK